MQQFFAMGGYAAFVWPAYGLSVIGLVGLALFIWRRGKTLREKLAKLEASRSGGAPSEPSGLSGNADKNASAD
ncbi:MAG TPA: heme exporter protein CcmD [Parvularculaceae bacterium]|nr:heme exporter protein CcmD [Parvularculaceae bacterium]